MFIVDFLSSIPYKYVAKIFEPIEKISFFKILKIARISRFAPFVQRLELNAEDKAVSRGITINNWLFCDILTVTFCFHSLLKLCNCSSHSC